MDVRAFVNAAFLALPFPVPLAAVAQTPVAIVEELDSKTAGLELMDYLTDGRTIRLADDERMVVGYLKSCWREIIVGGTVTIGVEQSTVQNGNVQRSKVRCDAGESATSKETAVSGAMVFRGGKRQQPRLTVYALAPVFAIKGDGQLSIERLDRKDTPISVPTSARQRRVDLNESNIFLSAGGVYRATHGASEVVFKVDESPDIKAENIIGRLVRLQPPD